MCVNIHLFHMSASRIRPSVRLVRAASSGLCVFQPRPSPRTCPPPSPSTNHSVHNGVSHQLGSARRPRLLLSMHGLLRSFVLRCQARRRFIAITSTRISSPLRFLLARLAVVRSHGDRTCDDESSRSIEERVRARWRCVEMRQRTDHEREDAQSTRTHHRRKLDHVLDCTWTAAWRCRRKFGQLPWLFHAFAMTSAKWRAALAVFGVGPKD